MPDILLVANDPVVVDIVSTAISFKGDCTIRRAASSCAGIFSLRKTPPTLVIVDVPVGSTSGVDIAREGAARRVPVLLLGESISADAYGGNSSLACICKPFAARELLARLDGLLALAAERQKNFGAAISVLRAQLQRSREAQLELQRIYAALEETRELARAGVARSQQVAQSTAARNGRLDKRAESLVRVKITEIELAGRMRQMRIWLDDCGFEPARFVYLQDSDSITVEVAFIKPAEAASFAEHFCGDFRSVE